MKGIFIHCMLNLSFALNMETYMNHVNLTRKEHLCLRVSKVGYV